MKDGMEDTVFADPTSRIIHLSDLHFGTVIPELCDSLLDIIESSQPTVVVVSGDLTQRAKERQFQEAAEFLKRITFPTLVVPGNHDVPLWNIYYRFFHPLDRYKRIITSDMAPVFRNKNLLVLGLNSARSFTIKEGGVSKEQRDIMRKVFGSAPADVFKVVVFHHPLVDCMPEDDFAVIDGAAEALAVLESIGVEMSLTGHLHHQYACESVHERSILMIQAGTALSHRTRDFPNSFNVLDVEPAAVTLTIYEWNTAENKFTPGRFMRFEKAPQWRPAPVKVKELKNVVETS